MTENTVHATYLSQLQYPSAQGYLRQMAIGAYGGDSPLTIAERKRMREAAAPACNIV